MSINAPAPRQHYDDSANILLQLFVCSFIGIVGLLIAWPGILLGLLLFGVGWLVFQGGTRTQWASVYWLSLVAIGAIGLLLLVLLDNPSHHLAAQLHVLAASIPTHQTFSQAIQELQTILLPRLLMIAWPFWLVCSWVVGLFGAPLIHYLLPQSAEQQLLLAEQRMQRIDDAKSLHAAKAATHTPLSTKQGTAILGVAIRGNLTTMQEKRWCVLPESELKKHGVVVGASGSGKTITLLRLAYLAAKVYGWSVYYLDAKGDRATAAQFLALMELAGLNPDRVRMFPSEPYHGFRGDGAALVNRLMAVESYSEPYYQSIAKHILTALCMDDQQEPPRTSHELFARFGPLEQETKLSKAEVNGVYYRYQAFFGALGNKLNGDWAFEDADAAYMLLDGLALKEEASSLGRYLLEDFAHFAALRKAPYQPVLLIIDEFSALSARGTDAANLFERLRSYNAAVIVSSQSYAGLGEDAERILDAANFLLLHRSAAPDKLTARSGRTRRAAQAKQTRQAAATGKGMIQLQEEDAAHPDVVRRLQVGEALLVAHGRNIKARITPLPELDRELWKAQERVSTPARFRARTIPLDDFQIQDDWVTSETTSHTAADHDHDDEPTGLL